MCSYPFAASSRNRVNFKVKNSLFAKLTLGFQFLLLFVRVLCDLVYLSVDLNYYLFCISLYCLPLASTWKLDERRRLNRKPDKVARPFRAKVVNRINLRARRRVPSYFSAGLLTMPMSHARWRLYIVYICVYIYCQSWYWYFVRRRCCRSCFRLNGARIESGFNWMELNGMVSIAVECRSTFFWGLSRRWKLVVDSSGQQLELDLTLSEVLSILKAFTNILFACLFHKIKLGHFPRVSNYCNIFFMMDMHVFF